MAKTIATITGTALVPGVSRNGRWYKPEHVAEAVRSAQERIRAGAKPMVMLTFHGADDNSREIAASLTDVSLNENGGADFAAGFTDTPAGWDIARMADTTDGKPPHLKTVSIRGAWTGKVRKERGPGGQVVETADGVELEGIDFTKSPGVTGAEIKTFDWVTGGATETTERVLITESVEEARVTITEETPPAGPEAARDALRALLGEAATVPMSKRDSGIKGAKGVPYADPGYQPDGKQRYELDSATHIRAAWAFISQAKNAKPYTGQQLKRIKGRIKSAAAKAGVTITDEGWCVAPALEVTEALVEYYGGDPDSCGSYSLSATNGPTTVTVCSYGLDPADLHVVLAQACSAASAALCSIDPDMDGDIDVPGADAEDDDGDADQMDNGDGVEDLVTRLMAAVRGESAEDPQALLAEAMSAAAVTETAASDPAPEPAAANQGMEAPVTETPTTEAAGQVTAATAYTQADLDAAVARAMAAEKARRKARKAAQAGPAETAAPPAAAVTETADQRIARLVDERVAAAVAAQAPPAVTETDEQRIDRLVSERMTAAKQDLMESGGGPGRKGLVAEHSGGRPAGDPPADFPMKDGAMIPMERWTEAQRQAVGATLQTHVLGDKAVF
jgi:hypothetical protein